MMGAILEGSQWYVNVGAGAALIENSKRLQKTLAILNTRGPSTTKQISDFTGSEATHSDIHELRQNGYDITCKYSGRSATGRKIYTYELWKYNA